ncbi:MAG TPA: energy transducer TonB [Azospira sp.]|nr:energy transducer TonB [Azospira sp.]
MWRADGQVGERRLPALLLVSLAVHAGALAWTRLPARPSADALPAVSMLFASLRLAAASPAAGPSPSAPAPQATPAVRAPREARRLPVRHDARAPSAVLATAGPTTPTVVAEARPAPAAPAVPAASPALAASAPVAAESATAASSPASTDAVRQLDDYGQRLAELFSRQQQYPRLAALRGWEGEVRVRLSVARQGGLSGVRLERSSGYEVLDRHALAMIEEIGRLPPPPAELSGDVQVVVPVRYKLRKPA